MHGKSKYSDIDRLKAYQLYCEIRNITKMSGDLGIPAPTLTLWKKKYKWDEKIEKSYLKTKKFFINQSKEIEKVLSDMADVENLQDVVTSPKDLIFPSVFGDNNIPVVTDDDLHIIMSETSIKQEVIILKILQRAVRTAIEGGIKIKNWNELIATQKFTTSRMDALRNKMYDIEKRVEEDKKRKMLYAGHITAEDKNVKEEEIFFSGEEDIFKDEDLEGI